MKKIPFLFLILTSILLSCEDDPIPSDVETLVFGRIYDSTNDIPILNQKVRLAEYLTQGTFAGTRYNFKGYVDSTLTDFNGEYQMPFKTTGNGNKYKIELEYSQEVHIPNLEEFVQEDNIGSQEELNFEALKLFPVDLKINTTDNISNQIFIYTQFGGNQIPLIEPSTQSSVRRIWVDKNIVNQINLRIESVSPYLNYYVDLPVSGSTELYEFEIEVSSSDFQ